MSRGSPIITLRISRPMLRGLRQLATTKQCSMTDLIRGEVQQLLARENIDYTTDELDGQISIEDTTSDA